MVLRLGPGKDVEVGAGELVIGRDEHCEVALDDPKVSRRHAAVRGLPDGRLELRDLGTTNGTFVDEQRIEGTATLGGGERVRVGRTTIEVVAAGAGAATVFDTGAAAGAGVAGAAGAGEPAQAERESEPAAETGEMEAVPEERQKAEPDQRSEQAEPAKEQVPAAAAVATGQVAQPVRPSVIERIKLRKAVTRATVLGGVAVVLALAVAALFLTGVLGGSKSEPTASQVVEKVGPSTVAILGYKDGNLEDRGTGWVYDAGQGLIVTNAHVVNGATTFKVGLGTRAKERRDAEVVAVAPCEDMAMLKVADTQGLKTLPLATQSSLKRGQEVVVVGYPGTARVFGKPELTADTGVVSNPRTRYEQVNLPGAEGLPAFSNVVQTDAPINHGNSGGPMVDLDGNLVGINTAKSPQQDVEGQNYAIGVDRVKQVASQLAAGKSAGWTGLRLTYLNPDTLRQKNLPPAILVDGAVAGTPAAGLDLSNAGLLVAVNDAPMDGSLAGYCKAAAKIGSGQPVSLTLASQDGTLQRVDTQVK